MAKFQKRHYEAIAEALQEAFRYAERLEDPSGKQRVGVDIARRYIADALGRDNADFKKGRFIAACEPGANVRARG